MNDDRRPLGGRKPPHSLEAEEALIGGLLIDRDAIAQVERTIYPDEFYRPGHAHIYAAIVTLYRRGDPADAITVTEYLRAAGLLEAAGGQFEPVRLMAAAPGSSNVAYYCAVVMELAARRRAIAAAGALMETFYGEVTLGEGLTGARIDAATADLRAAQAGIAVHTPEDLFQLEDFLTNTVVERRPWVVPGLFRERWRGMVVAPEGIGKTVLGRQIAMHAGQGIHPFTGEDIEPVVTMMADFENPGDVILEQARPISNTLKMLLKHEPRGFMPDMTWLFHREQGIRLSNRVDRQQFEAAIQAVGPKLICLGPLYKIFRKEHGQSDEDAALDAQAVLDDLRTRYDFAIYIEHHAPKKQGGVRELEPFGSAAWLRWPEFGLKLLPTDDEGHTLEVGRFRKDRVQAAWPMTLERGSRGGDRPWNGIYNQRWLNMDGRPGKRMDDIEHMFDPPPETIDFTQSRHEQEL